MSYYRVTIENLSEEKAQPMRVEGDERIVAAAVRAFANQVDPPKPSIPPKSTCRSSAVRAVEEGMS